MSDTEDRIIHELRRRGLRATPQRLAILRAVLGSRDHPTAEQVFNRVRRTNPSISLSTVYNTLHLLRDLGLLSELVFGSRSRFDPNTRAHLNLVCLGCGEVRDVETPELGEMVDKIAGMRGFRVAGHGFDVYGYCRRCGGEG